MPRRHATRVIDLPDAKNCIIAVLSDTHGKPHPNLFPALERNRPSLILHAGDVGDLDLITELEGISQTVYVRGNTDPTGPMWPESVSLRIRLEASRRLDLLLIHFAVARLRLNREAQILLRREPCSDRGLWPLPHSLSRQATKHCSLQPRIGRTTQDGTSHNHGVYRNFRPDRDSDIWTSGPGNSGSRHHPGPLRPA